MSARIAQAPLHRLTVKVEQLSEGIKGLQSHLVDFASLRRRWYRSMSGKAGHVLRRAPLIAYATVLRRIIVSSSLSGQVSLGAGAEIAMISLWYAMRGARAT